MSVPLPPKLNPNCQCICHYQSGVMHVVACCHAPVADLAQASVAAALEAAALVMGERQALISREQVADLIRADIPPTLSAAMELPEVKDMKAALELARNRLQRLAIEFTEESEGRYEVNEWAEEAAAALAAIKEPKP